MRVNEWEMRTDSVNHRISERKDRNTESQSSCGASKTVTSCVLMTHTDQGFHLAVSFRKSSEKQQQLKEKLY